MLLEDLGEAGILGKEAVAGVDRVRAGDFAGGEQCRDIQIALSGWRRTDADAFIGEADMHGIGVGRGVNGDCLNAQLLAGTLNP